MGRNKIVLPKNTNFTYNRRVNSESCRRRTIEVNYGPPINAASVTLEKEEASTAPGTNRGGPTPSHNPTFNMTFGCLSEAMNNSHSY